MAPEHSPLWEHFRNIDLDKEAKVLQVGADGCMLHLCAWRLCTWHVVVHVGVHKQARVLWLRCWGISCLAPLCSSSVGCVLGVWEVTDEQ
jgi:hypothetical protein